MHMLRSPLPSNGVVEDSRHLRRVGRGRYGAQSASIGNMQVIQPTGGASPSSERRLGLPKASSYPELRGVQNYMRPAIEPYGERSGHYSFIRRKVLPQHQVVLEHWHFEDSDINARRPHALVPTSVPGGIGYGRSPECNPITVAAQALMSPVSRTVTFSPVALQTEPQTRMSAAETASGFLPPLLAPPLPQSTDNSNDYMGCSIFELTGEPRWQNTFVNSQNGEAWKPARIEKTRIEEQTAASAWRTKIITGVMQNGSAASGGAWPLKSPSTAASSSRPALKRMDNCNFEERARSTVELHAWAGQLMQQMNQGQGYVAPSEPSLHQSSRADPAIHAAMSNTQQWAANLLLATARPDSGARVRPPSIAGSQIDDMPSIPAPIDDMFDTERALAILKQLSDTEEISSEDLLEALRLLGHKTPSEEWIAAALADARRVVCSGDGVLFKMDFCRFVAAYERRRWKHFKDAFNSVDKERSGRMGQSQLATLFGRMGIEPMKGVLSQLLEEVVGPCVSMATEVDVTQFAEMCECISSRGGLPRQVAAQLKELFERYDMSDEGLLGVEELPLALQYDALPSDVMADDLLVKSFTSKIKEGLREKEFLEFARRRRELGLDLIRRVFSEADREHDGKISEGMLESVFVRLGYIDASPEAIREIVAECKLQGKTGLLFEEVHRILERYCQNWGFTNTELEEIRTAFRMLDADESGGICKEEVASLLRWLGYPSTNNAHNAQVVESFDTDFSNQLEFDEAARLLQSHRREIIRHTRNAFKKAAVGDRMAVSEIRKVLVACGYTPSHNEIRSLEETAGVKPGGKAEWTFLDFWEHISLVEQYKRWAGEKLRKNQGFSESQVEKFRNTFDMHTVAQAEFVNEAGCRELLGELFPDIEHSEDTHARVQRWLQIVGGLTDKGICFTQLLRIMRLQHDHDDITRTRRDSIARRNNGFTATEARQLRQLFNEADADNSGSLDLNELMRLLSSVVQITRARTMELKKHLADVDVDGDQQLDFDEFLRIMRLVIDHDWGQINAAAAARIKGRGSHAEAEAEAEGEGLMSRARTMSDNGRHVRVETKPRATIEIQIAPIAEEGDESSKDESPTVVTRRRARCKTT